MNILNRLRWVFIRSQLKEVEPRALKMERVVTSLNQKTHFEKLRFKGLAALKSLNMFFRRA